MKRKLLVILLSIACIFCLVFGLAGCASNDGDGEEYIPAVTSGKRYNDNITYKLSYTSDEECPNGNIENEKLHTSINFEVGKVYYMAIDFTISSFETEGWNSSFTASVNIFPAEVVEVKLEEVATSSFTEGVSDNRTDITATYSIPEGRTAERTYRIILRLTRLDDIDRAEIDLSFYGDSQGISNILSIKDYIVVHSESLTFTLNEDGQAYTVTKGGDVSIIAIPSTYEGLPVTSIDSSAFSDNFSLKIVYIPDSVISIGRGAFNNCRNLKSITIPDSVTTIGDGVFFNCTSLENIIIPNGVSSIGERMFDGCTSLKSITIPDSVTTIGEYAFRGCSNLNSIIIPDSVTSIGGYAFWDCTSLKNITLPDGVTAIDGGTFNNCTSLESVTFGNGVTFIGSSAFRYCRSLTSIIIPDSVTSIGRGAFSGCSNLESIIIPFVGDAKNTPSDIYQYPFGYIFDTISYTGAVATRQSYYGEYTNSTTDSTYYIPASLKSVTVTGGNILYGAFQNCTNLESITIPDSVTSIGNYAFYNCTNLESITIPDSVTSIGEYAFYNCERHTNIKIPDSVTSIGSYAFNSCTSLESITIPNSVTSIGNYAFNSCTSLNAVYVSDIESWCNISFGGSFFGNIEANPLYYAHNLYLNNKLVTELAIPNAITVINDYAFAGFGGTSITIPDSVTEIDISAFNQCTSLESITIPNSVTSIGSFAFSGCTSLKSVTIGNCVTSIENGAFNNCTSLTSITVPDSVTYIGREAFSGCTSIKSVIFKNTEGWHTNVGINISSSSLADPATAATYLVSTYCDHTWYHN